jgi:hypothetical protein
MVRVLENGQQNYMTRNYRMTLQHQVPIRIFRKKVLINSRESLVNTKMKKLSEKNLIYVPLHETY